MTITTYPEIDNFKRVRQETTAAADSLSQEEADTRPDPEIWSPGEVLDHLALFDQLFGREVEELIGQAREGGGTAFVWRSFADYGISLPLVPQPLMPLFEVPFAVSNIFFPPALRRPFFRSRLVPASAPKVVVPRRGRPIAELVAGLGVFPERLDVWVVHNPDLDLRRLCYYNPLVGYTNAVGVLEFLANHEQRHQAQLAEITARVTGGAAQRG